MKSFRKSLVIGAFLFSLLPLGATAEEGAAGQRPGVTIAARANDPQLIDLAVATRIADRQPEEAGDSFPASVGQLYCWAAVKNSGEPTEVTIIWRFGDSVVTEKSVSIGTSSRWRSWTRQRINEKNTGSWSCEVVDQNKESLGKATFTVQ